MPQDNVSPMALVLDAIPDSYPTSIPPSEPASTAI